jgi:uncharacterized membrane protein YGL010W
MNLHPFFIRQLTTYASYHRHPRNRGTHFIGIPAIVFAILCAVALWHPRVLGLPVSGAWVVGVVAFLGWLALDVGIGLAMLAMLVPMILAANWIVASGGLVAAWAVFAIFFVFGWIFQIVGHMWEGKRPALLDNLFQAFIGPMFIVAEILIMLGLRPDLRAAVELVGITHRR